MKLNNVVDKLIREGIPDGNKAIEDSMRRSLPYEEQASEIICRTAPWRFLAA